MTSNNPIGSHVSNFTDYMSTVFDEVCQNVPKGARILDIPAGNGLLGDQLRTVGYEMVQADINAERPDYVHANMEEPLPFDSALFDAVICLEGIEHVSQQPQLLAELTRVIRPQGLVFISTPNISNIYSRLTFLLTGHFYKFDPRNFGFEKQGELIDKFHIAPISLYHLAYAMASNGAQLVATHGDRFKKKALLPFALLLWPLLAWNEARVVARLDPRMHDPHHPYPRKLFFNAQTYLSRSLIAVFIKNYKVLCWSNKNNNINY
jgi:SAM-dependent methyltransferase